MVSLLVDHGVGFIQIEITTPYFLLLWRLNYPISKTCMLVRRDVVVNHGGCFI
jgi:hypothetical protein